VVQPDEIIHNAGTSQTYMLGRFSFDVINANVAVTELVLTGTGDGDWNIWLDAADGVQVWADDGDGEFDPATDTLLYAGPGAPVVTATFATALLVPNYETRELFVRLNLTAHAGQGVAAEPATFAYAVATPGDVTASAGVQVLFGTPPPATGVLEMIEFFVSAISPRNDLVEGGAMLTLTGSGFMEPFEMRIGDTLVEGTPVITDGTQVTGLIVPAGENGRYDIHIRSGNLPEYTHNRQFRYGAADDSSDSNGCTTGTHPGPGLLTLAALLLLTLTRRRQALRGFA
jgi:MYXO-CTERM domain-containing protein